MLGTVRRFVSTTKGFNVLALKQAQVSSPASLGMRWQSTTKNAEGVREAAATGENDDAPEEGGKKRHKKILRKYDRDIITKLREHNAEHEAKAAALGLEWRTVCSTILHRYPVISPDPEPWEIAMSDLQEEITDKKREWFFQQVGGDTAAANLIGTSNPSYEEIIATLPFKPAPRITVADTSNDTRSPNRRLAESSFLIVKRNRAEFPWQFPQGKILPEKDGESARAAAERVIDRAVGKVNRWFVSNSPAGHICYPYPAEMQKARQQYGAKVYFYRCQLVAGSVKLETRLYTDYAWVARDEISKYTEDKLTGEFLTALLPY